MPEPFYRLEVSHMDAKEYLDQVRVLDSRINKHLKEKEQWREMAFSISADTTQPHYNPNRPTNAPYEKCVEMADALEKRITAEIDRLVDLKVEITSQIMRIGDSDCETILLLRYVKLLAWSDIVNEMNYSERWVYGKHAEALDRFSAVLKSLQ